MSDCFFLSALLYCCCWGVLTLNIKRNCEPSFPYVVAELCGPMMMAEHPMKVSWWNFQTHWKPHSRKVSANFWLFLHWCVAMDNVPNIKRTFYFANMSNIACTIATRENGRINDVCLKFSYFKMDIGLIEFCFDTSIWKVLSLMQFHSINKIKCKVDLHEKRM